MFKEKRKICIAHCNYSIVHEEKATLFNVNTKTVEIIVTTNFQWGKEYGWLGITFTIHTAVYSGIMLLSPEQTDVRT